MHLGDIKFCPLTGNIQVMAKGTLIPGVHTPAVEPEPAGSEREIVTKCTITPEAPPFEKHMSARL